MNLTQHSRDADASNAGPADATCWLEFACFDDGLHLPPQSASINPPLASFPQFAILPIEIRLRIWSFLIQPRIILVCCFQHSDDHDVALRSKTFRSRKRGSLVPVLLHVNHESRLVALKHYECSFSWTVSRMLAETPVSQPSRIWFNFDIDALYLTGELEVFDSYGSNSPMAYFLRKEDAARVKHVVSSCADLGYPHQEMEQVFGCLWHIVDRFPAAKQLLVTVTEHDEANMSGSLLYSTENAIQKLWSGWMRGTAVTTSRLADKPMLLIREDELSQYLRMTNI